MQVTKMQSCNLAYQDVSDPVVSFQRKLLTSNVLDTGHGDVKLLFSSPWGWAAESQWENMKTGKAVGEKRDNNTHLLSQLQRKSEKKGECEIGTKSPHLPIGRTY